MSSCLLQLGGLGGGGGVPFPAPWDGGMGWDPFWGGIQQMQMYANLVDTLLGTKISSPKVCLKMIFLFLRWDMLVFFWADRLQLVWTDGYTPWSLTWSLKSNGWKMTFLLGPDKISGAMLNFLGVIGWVCSKDVKGTQIHCYQLKTLTHRKTNMDTQNDGLEILSPFERWPFLVAMLNFCGVSGFICVNYGCLNPSLLA